jgi:hypothetical protein
MNAHILVIAIAERDFHVPLFLDRVDNSEISAILTL